MVGLQPSVPHDQRYPQSQEERQDLENTEEVEEEGEEHPVHPQQAKLRHAALNIEIKPWQEKLGDKMPIKEAEVVEVADYDAVPKPVQTRKRTKDKGHGITIEVSTDEEVSDDEVTPKKSKKDDFDEKEEDAISDEDVIDTTTENHEKSVERDASEKEDTEDEKDVDHKESATRDQQKQTQGQQPLDDQTNIESKGRESIETGEAKDSSQAFVDRKDNIDIESANKTNIAKGAQKGAAQESKPVIETSKPITGKHSTQDPNTSNDGTALPGDNNSIENLGAKDTNTSQTAEDEPVDDDGLRKLISQGDHKVENVKEDTDESPLSCDVTEDEKSVLDANAEQVSKEKEQVQDQAHGDDDEFTEPVPHDPEAEEITVTITEAKDLPRSVIVAAVTNKELLDVPEDNGVCDEDDKAPSESNASVDTVIEVTKKDSNARDGEETITDKGEAVREKNEKQKSGDSQSKDAGKDATIDTEVQGDTAHAAAKELSPKDQSHASEATPHEDDINNSKDFDSKQKDEESSRLQIDTGNLDSTSGSSGSQPTSSRSRSRSLTDTQEQIGKMTDSDRELLGSKGELYEGLVPSFQDLPGSEGNLDQSNLDEEGMEEGEDI